MKRIVNQPKEIDGLRVVQNGEEIKKCLLNGETVMHWEFGNSLFPIIKHAEYCRIHPITSPDDVRVGDAVFCCFNWHHFMVHRCIEKYERDDETWFKIASTGNTVYGWTNQVYGVAESTNIFQEETRELVKQFTDDED